jgi:phosphatidylglycerol:prolipoprotein diacylglycerol transferase
MYPVFIRVGGVAVNSYSVLFVVGLLAGLLVVRREARRRSWNVRSATWMAVTCTAVGFIGAHFLYCCTRFALTSPEWWKEFFRFGYGNVWYGGLLAGWMVLHRWARSVRVPLAEAYDVAALAAIAAQGIGRIGCLLGGCCYGSPTALPWGVMVRRGDFAGSHVHPWPLYEATYLLLVFLWLWRARIRTTPGMTAIHYLLLTAFGRFALEFWRGDSIRGFAWGWLSTSQVVALALIAVAGIMHGRVVRRSRLRLAGDGSASGLSPPDADRA